MGRARATSSSSSSIDSSSNHLAFSSTGASSSSGRRDLTPDLRLGLSLSTSPHYARSLVFFPIIWTFLFFHFILLSVLAFGLKRWRTICVFIREQPSEWPVPIKPALEEDENECNSATFFVKVYMEGIPIGRKLDLLAHESYNDLIRTLEHMFNTNIIC